MYQYINVTLCLDIKGQQREITDITAETGIIGEGK